MRIRCIQLNVHAPLPGSTHTDPFAVGQAAFGEGEGPIFLSNLRCRGNETNLLECPNVVIRIQFCRHAEDAGVFCAGMFLSPCSAEFEL